MQNEFVYALYSSLKSYFVVWVGNRRIYLTSSFKKYLHSNLSGWFDGG